MKSKKAKPAKPVVKPVSIRRGRKNAKSVSAKVIIKQMQEPRPLPMGRKEFEEWSDRIISGALIPGASPASQKFALADCIMHLGPTESHKPDAHFIHTLRKFAVNQVAHELRQEYRETEKARMAAEEEAKKPKVVSEEIPDLA